MTSQKIIILVVSFVATLALGILIGAAGYYYLFPCGGVIGSTQTQENGMPADISEAAKQKMELERVRKLEEDFPDVVSGTLSLTATNPTLKTSDGTEYLLWPPFSTIDYQKNGYLNGQIVEFRGKILLKDVKNNITEDRLFIATTEVLPK